MANLAGQQYQCVNAFATSASSDNLSHHDMLNWVNDSLRSNYKKIEELANGAAYAQLTDLVFPGTVPLNKIKFRTNLESDYVENFKIVQDALKKVGCDKEISVDRLVKSCYQDNFEFLQWFKKFFDANYDGHEYNALEARDNIFLGSYCDEEQNDINISENSDKQIALVSRPRLNGAIDGEVILVRTEDDDYDHDDDKYDFNKSLIDHSWSKKILRLVGNKARLMESFSWLSTVGGGFSALGERDSNFSIRAGALSLGQQLQLAELLGDNRLKVMCHLFAALAALQLDNRRFCMNYIKNVIIPLMKGLPYRDPILTNMLRHICFRVHTMDRLEIAHAIEGRNGENGRKKY